MIVRNMTPGATLKLVQAAELAHVKVVISRQMNNKGTAYTFTLKLSASKAYQRTSSTMTNKDGEPRRINAVCWHGHAAFFRELFKLEPTAIVSSSRMGTVRYTAENFEDVYPATGDWNIGSQYAPCAFRDACDYDTHPINRK